MIYMTLILAVGSLFANEVQLKSLTSAETVSLNELIQDEATLMVLFQRDCVACKKQIKDLDCFSDRKIVLLGSFSSEESLRKEYLKMRVKHPSYMIQPSDLKNIGVSEAMTPQLIDMKLKKISYGYQSCKSRRHL
jgi:hypothetical protein